jgi:hypothetical protein
MDGERSARLFDFISLEPIEPVRPGRAFVLAAANVADVGDVFFQILPGRRRGPPGRYLSGVRVGGRALHDVQAGFNEIMR